MTRLGDILRSLADKADGAEGRLDALEGSLAGLSALPQNKVLWKGALYMKSSHTARLSEKVSGQRHGIVLVWSQYDNGSPTYCELSFFFVPKWLVAQTVGSHGVNCGHVGYDANMAKYVYVHDDRVVGRDCNAEASNSTGGATFKNSRFVLVAVVGV